MIEVTKEDWKLFRDRIGQWQEAYIEKLNAKYIALLSEDKLSSDKFWSLWENIRKDIKTPGVQLQLRKSDVPLDLVHLLMDGVISQEDLEGFSDDLKERVMFCVNSEQMDSD